MPTGNLTWIFFFDVQPVASSLYRLKKKIFATGRARIPVRLPLCVGRSWHHNCVWGTPMLVYKILLLRLTFRRLMSTIVDVPHR